MKVYFDIIPKSLPFSAKAGSETELKFSWAVRSFLYANTEIRPKGPSRRPYPSATTLREDKIPANKIIVRNEFFRNTLSITSKYAENFSKFSGYFLGTFKKFA